MKKKAISKEKKKAQQQIKVQQKTKILDVFQIKKSNNSDLKDKKPQNLRDNFFICRIRPKNCKSQIMVKYDQCKKHFPLALLDFYQNHMKLKKKPLDEKNELQKFPQATEENIQPSNQEFDIHAESKQQSPKKTKSPANKLKQQKTVIQRYQQDLQPILDYDSIISRKATTKKKIYVVFSLENRQTNPYILQLKQYQKTSPEEKSGIRSSKRLKQQN